MSIAIIVILIAAIFALYRGGKFKSKSSNQKNITSNNENTKNDPVKTVSLNRSIDQLTTNDGLIDEERQPQTFKPPLNDNKTKDIRFKVLDQKTDEPYVAPPPQKMVPRNLEIQTALDAGADANYYSTTALGKILGIVARPFIFEELTRLGYIERDTRYYLTELGMSVGGKYRTGENEKSWPVWPVAIGEKLKPIKHNFLDKTQFRLYHMTHIDNLPGILRTGLRSHNAASNKIDISNKDVNARRSKKDTIHHQSLHDYVPMYFNPRNAMLFQKQSELGRNLVVLEINKAVCLKNKTIFTDRNAATSQCKFLYCLSQLEAIDWNKINSKDWTEGGVTFVDLKQSMMAECLVNSHVPTDFITKIHINENHLPTSLVNLLKEHPNISVKRGSSIFFQLRG